MSHRAWKGHERRDALLAFPEMHSSGMVRGLMHFARKMEQFGELSADMSSTSEKIILGLIQKSDDFSAKAILASAAARYITSFVSLLSMNGFKVIGAGFFALSFLASVCALGMSHLGPYYIDSLKLDDSHHRKPSPQKQMYKLSSSTREKIIEASLRRATSDPSLDSDSSSLSLEPTASSSPLQPRAQNRSELRDGSNEPENPNRSERSQKRPNNLKSLYKRRKECGPLTQNLLAFSHGIYKLVNKLLVSWDKHLAYRLGKKYGRNTTGQILGTRLALVLTTTASAAIGLLMGPLGFSLWQLGVAACLVALMLGLLAVAVSAYEKPAGGAAAPRHGNRALSTAGLRPGLTA